MLTCCRKKQFSNFFHKFEHFIQLQNSNTGQETNKINENVLHGKACFFFNKKVRDTFSHLLHENTHLCCSMTSHKAVRDTKMCRENNRMLL